MPLLTRYVIWELLKQFLAALSAMTGLVMLVGVAQEAINHGLGPAADLADDAIHLARSAAV